MFTRREFLALVAAAALCPDLSEAQETERAPYLNLPDDALITVRGQDLRFGSSTYPYRKGNEWTIEECLAIGFNAIRVSLPREHVELGPDDGPFEPRLFKEPCPEVTNRLRHAGLDVVMTLHGHAGNAKGVPQEWPRKPDGAIDGQAAATSFANYTRWVVNHTKDFVGTYELWNEAFGHIDDQKWKKSFGPGGSLENADGYAAMMLPALENVKKYAPHARTTIEGNYWNVQTSVARSPGFQKLLALADYVVYHPYSYEPGQYSRIGPRGKPSAFYEMDSYYKSVNPGIRWFFTEYNVEPKITGQGVLQAKALLRATVLHLRHGVTHLFPFALSYPSQPCYTFIDEPGHHRRPVWHAFQRFLAACCLKETSHEGQLSRTSELPSGLRDLAIATGLGFTYCLWQETERLPDDTRPVEVSVSLQGPLKLESCLDPITGKPVGAQFENSTLKLPVLDYPCLCRFRVG